MIFLALPVMNEELLLPQLIEAISSQTFTDFKVVVCVNQPETYWDIPEKISICVANQRTIEYLEKLGKNRFLVIDKTSRGNGWIPPRHGIGFARKTIMDFIRDIAADDDIILSMDADTTFNPTYFSSIADNFAKNPACNTISIPYYHRLSDTEQLDRAMLRYEIYMRAFAVNMWRIGSPYCFTALGSAMATTVKGYKTSGGMTPKLSGEDFYFLQKVVKTSQLCHWNDEMVFPATRYSDRVFFGTGPALIRGSAGDWSSYPVYHRALFDLIFDTYQLLPLIFVQDISTPLDEFLIYKFGELPWTKLRKNFKTQQHFVRACHEKIDGLRILQFLKENQLNDEITSQLALTDLLLFYQHQFTKCIQNEYLTADFENSSIDKLNGIRDALFEIEMQYRKGDATII